MIKNFSVKKNYAFIDTLNLKGKKLKSWSSITKNYHYLLKAIKHYKKVFKRQKYHKIHGDLTLDNIFFTKKNTIFFDWEFYKAKKQLWGYDIVYLILSSICIPYIEDKRFTKTEEFYFLKLWRIIQKLKIDKSLLNDPFTSFESNLKSDKVFILSNKISKSKFFPFLTPNSFKKKIYFLINKNYD